MKPTFRNRFSALALFGLMVFLQISGCAPSTRVLAVNDKTPPVTNVWYGSRQVFGRVGLPQKWVNILGNVSDPESGVREVTYTLNGGKAVRLRLGPDNRRLVRQGDFNIEIDSSSLNEGDNRVVITAANQVGLNTVTAVTVEFHKRTWPLPYAVDWSKVKNAQEVLQIVDGRWSWDARGIRPVELGYDRLLAVGDMSWTNYEVTVPMTVYGIDPSSYQVPGSPGAGFGITIHWQGHTDDPAKCDWPAQPHCGWKPNGAHNWYSFKQSGADTLAIETESDGGQAVITTRKFTFGHTYVFKARVIDSPSGNSYFFKVWEPGVESEPAQWTLQRTTPDVSQGQINQESGSFLLALHRVDALIGDITVTPVGKQ